MTVYNLLQPQGIGIQGPVGGSNPSVVGDMGAGPAGALGGGMNPMMMMALQAMLQKRRRQQQGPPGAGPPQGGPPTGGPMGAGPAGQLPTGTPLATLVNSAAGGPFAQSPGFGRVPIQGTHLGSFSDAVSGGSAGPMGGGPAGPRGAGPADPLFGNVKHDEMNPQGAGPPGLFGRRRHPGEEPAQEDQTRGYGMGAGPSQVLYDRLYGRGQGAGPAAQVPYGPGPMIPPPGVGAGPAVADPNAIVDPTGPPLQTGPAMPRLDAGFVANHPNWQANHPGASPMAEQGAAMAWALLHGNQNLGGGPIINEGGGGTLDGRPIINRGGGGQQLAPLFERWEDQHPNFAQNHPGLPPGLLQNPAAMRMIEQMMQMRSRGFQRPAMREQQFQRNPRLQPL